eukprot:scaffold2838_cov376-Prasinococcus_capsulatus_cf.AAC.3
MPAGLLTSCCPSLVVSHPIVGSLIERESLRLVLTSVRGLHQHWPVPRILCTSTRECLRAGVGWYGVIHLTALVSHARGGVQSQPGGRYGAFGTHAALACPTASA